MNKNIMLLSIGFYGLFICSVYATNNQKQEASIMADAILLGHLERGDRVMQRMNYPNLIKNINQNLNDHPDLLKKIVKKIHTGPEEELQAIDYLLAFDYNETEMKIMQSRYRYNIFSDNDFNPCL